MPEIFLLKIWDFGGVDSSRKGKEQIKQCNVYIQTEYKKYCALFHSN